MKQLIIFLDILLTGLIAGVIFGVWVGYNPQYLTAATYVEQQQNAIRSLNVLMPVLGLLSIILTVTYAIMTKSHKLSRNILFAAVFFLIVSGLITRFGNQPINAIIMTWDAGNIPPTWTTLREDWWTFHTMRMISALIAFALIVWVTINTTKLR